MEPIIDVTEGPGEAFDEIAVERAVIGLTVGRLPDALLRYGVDRPVSVETSDPNAVLDVLTEGGSSYHVSGRSAEGFVRVHRADQGN